MEEFCNCRCHEPGNIIIHCVPCCNGKCLKCHKYLLSNLEEHTDNCEEYANPKSLFDENIVLRKELISTKRKLDWYKTIIKEILDNKTKGISIMPEFPKEGEIK